MEVAPGQLSKQPSQSVRVSMIIVHNMLPVTARLAANFINKRENCLAVCKHPNILMKYCSHKRQLHIDCSHFDID